LIGSRTTSRLLLGAGSILALVVSPPFSLAYFDAFGGAEESPPGWLANLRPGFVDRGWLGGGDPEGLYSAYGLWYGAFLALALVGLILLLRADLGERWKAGGWGVVATGLGLAVAGTFGDYSGIRALEALFLFELVGALVIAVGTVIVGVRMWQSGRRALGVGIGVIGPASLVLGSALLGHFPSGPLSVDLMAGLALAVGGFGLGAKTTE